MDNGSVVIARIPCPNAGPLFKTTASEVATMDFVSHPKILIEDLESWYIALPLGQNYPQYTRSKSPRLERSGGKFCRSRIHFDRRGLRNVAWRYMGKYRNAFQKENRRWYCLDWAEAAFGVFLPVSSLPRIRLGKLLTPSDMAIYILQKIPFQGAKKQRFLAIFRKK